MSTAGRAVTRRALLFGGVATAALVASPGHAARPGPPWTGSWATAPTPATPALHTLPAGCTVRQVVRLSLGGDAPRVRLTNAYGGNQVVISEVLIGLREGGPDSSDLRPDTIRPVTFGGRARLRLDAGGIRDSDPVPDLPLTAGADLVISLRLPERTRTGTVSPRAYQVNHVLTGNPADPPGGVEITRYVLLGGVSVRTPGPSAAVVAFGDSITCGAATTISANRRWPDLLAARLRAEGLPIGVLNAGIGGNRLLSGVALPSPESVSIGPSGLRRFGRDVLDQPGVSHVITLIGVNDLGAGASADELIAGHRRLIARARAAGLAVLGGTLLPLRGSRYDRDGRRGARAELNRWIRDGGEFDGVVDFDAAIRDGADPERLRPGYDSGDHLHPNDEGMLALASEVPLELLL